MGLTFVMSFLSVILNNSVFSLNTYSSLLFLLSRMENVSFPTKMPEKSQISCHLKPWLLAIPSATVFQQLTRVNMISLRSIRRPVEGY